MLSLLLNIKLEGSNMKRLLILLSIGTVPLCAQDSQPYEPPVLPGIVMASHNFALQTWDEVTYHLLNRPIRLAGIGELCQDIKEIEKRGFDQERTKLPIRRDWKKNRAAILEAQLSFIQTRWPSFPDCTK